MLFEPIRYLIVLAGTAISTYTDCKTGLILDKVTYLMIAAGILFTLADFVSSLDFLPLLIPLGVFGFGYLLYYAGKLGGGDVKIFTAMALLLPFYRNQPFILNVLLIAALSSISIVSVYYLAKYFLKGKRTKESRKDLLKAFLLGIAILLYLFALNQLGYLKMLHTLFLFVPILLGLAALAFQKGIYRNFFLKHISVSELEEDEIIAKEFVDSDILAESGLTLKGIIAKKDAEKLGLKKIPVYRNLPPFAPFLLLGVILSYFFPDFFFQLFFPF